MHSRLRSRGQSATAAYGQPASVDGVSITVESRPPANVTGTKFDVVQRDAAVAHALRVLKLRLARERTSSIFHQPAAKPKKHGALPTQWRRPFRHTTLRARKNSPADAAPSSNLSSGRPTPFWLRRTMRTDRSRAAGSASRPLRRRRQNRSRT
jgi:hypothetical protein